MSERPDPPPEGELIKAALKRSRLSARKAADQAGISEGRWRQIANGYQTVSRGTHVPVHAPAETLARMAQVVGITPQELEGVGRKDAAGELRNLGGTGEADPTTVESSSPDDLQARAIAAIMDSWKLTPGERERVLRNVEEYFRQHPQRPAPPAEPEDKRHAG